MDAMLGVLANSLASAPSDDSEANVTAILGKACVMSSITTLAVAAAVGPRPVRPRDVRLLDGPFKTGQDVAVKYLLSLEPDRFLANFRKDAGLEPKAEHYGGWESQGVSGHAGGHYVSACSLAYAATEDTRFLDRVNYMVDELAECQRANGNGYVAAIPNGKRVYADVAMGKIRSGGFDLNGCWVPNYTLHKLFAGLRDAYRLCGNAKALEVARGLADWFETTHAKLTDEQMQRVLACEHGGINETFVDLHVDTGDERYLALSRRFHHRAILEPLSNAEDILPGKHANTQIPKLTGLAARYDVTGDRADRAAAEFFWDRVVNHHSYVTGGHCDHEHFGSPDRLNDRLSTMTTETCNVYNMLRLTLRVFGWRPEVDVADFYERALLNHIRATQHPDGRVIYNLSLLPGHHKEYQSPYNGFTCCVGTGLENHVRYGEGIYCQSDDTLWVNLYIASELTWQDGAVRLRQDTEWPKGDRALFTVSCQDEREFAVRFRRPHWAGDQFGATVNGTDQTAADASGYVTVRRRWRSGDRVDVRFPMALRTESMPDNPRRIAVFYGPTLLAADLGPVDDPEADKADYVPVLLTEGRPVAEWVDSPADNASTFRTIGVGQPRDVTLVPFHSLHDRRYTAYLDVFTREEWDARQTELKAAAERERLLAARTVDLLRIGEMQPERDHNLTGDKTGAGQFRGRKWRHATDGGWFAFDMKIDSENTNELVLTYWGDEGGQRVFDILVEGTRIATQTLLRNQPGTFFDVAHALPEDITRGKDKVNIRFQAHADSWAGGLFGCRMLRGSSSQSSR